jgi:hypothetical protein
LSRGSARTNDSEASDGSGYKDSFTERDFHSVPPERPVAVGDSWQRLMHNSKHSEH